MPAGRGGMFARVSRRRRRVAVYMALALLWGCAQQHSVRSSAAAPACAPEVPLLGAGMTRPMPLECGESLPDARSAGTAVVEFVVQSDGTVGDICDVNRSDSSLVDAVRAYLRTCKFAPSEQAAKGPITVKMI